MTAQPAPTRRVAAGRSVPAAPGLAARRPPGGAERGAGTSLLPRLSRRAAALAVSLGVAKRRAGTSPLPRLSRRAAALAVSLGVAAGCAGPMPQAAEAPGAQAAPLPTVTLAAPQRADGGPGGQLSSTAAGPLVSHPTASDPGRPAATGTDRAPVVVLDPGHNGGNAAHPERANRQVPDGAGGTKPCNTVGAQTASGYPEHAFSYDVALRVRRHLVAHGVTVALTRSDDTGVGPCVDERARLGNAREADAVLSIHADGGPRTAGGFHVIEPAAAPAVIAPATHRLALAVRAALLAGSGLGYASYAAGATGLAHRADLAGLNLSSRPTIFVECGNMRNPADAAVLASAAGRERIARALAAGLLAALGSR